VFEKDIRCDSGYYEQERRFRDARMVCTNYALYTAELLRGRRWHDRRPTLLVSDEAHRLLDLLTAAEAVELDREMAATLGYTSPDFQEIQVAREWAEGIVKETEQAATRALRSREVNADKRVRLWRSVQALSKADDSFLVTRTGEKFAAGPVWPTYSARALFDSADTHLLMSATLWGGQFYMDLMGYDGKFNYVTADSPYDPERWPVHYQPVARMNAKATAQDWMAVGDRCHEIMHQNKEKGVIHVSSYEQIDKLARRLRRCRKCRGRLVIPAQGKKAYDGKPIESRAGTLARWRDMAGAWLIHPSVGEGESFDDDQCRTQIIAKIRYPDLGDPLVRARTQPRRDAADDEGAQARSRKAGSLGKLYYFGSTAAYTAQTVGRGMRHEKDHCITYILDESFGGLYDRNKRLFPSWFHRLLR
jgi:Rad3-related DNA helicase